MVCLPNPGLNWNLARPNFSCKTEVKIECVPPWSSKYKRARACAYISRNKRIFDRRLLRNTATRNANLYTVDETVVMCEVPGPPMKWPQYVGMPEQRHVGREASWLGRAMAIRIGYYGSACVRTQQQGGTLSTGFNFPLHRLKMKSLATVLKVKVHYVCA